jgi:hypothetical protein
MSSSLSTNVADIKNSGTLDGGNIQFQGGYDTITNEQDGETFFDGLSGWGYGLGLNTKSYITLNYLNFSRYYSGVYFYYSNNNTIITLSNVNNNINYGLYFNFSNNNTVTTISNANNNNSFGVAFYSSNNNIITTLTNANNGVNFGVSFWYSNNNTIITLSNANNNSQYGVEFDNSNNNSIKILSTTGNAAGGIYNPTGINYLYNALIAEGVEVGAYTNFANSRIFSHKHDQTAYHRIFTDGGQIDSVDTDRVGGTGIMWKLAVTSTNRASNYPLDLKIARIACVANKLVTVKAYMKITNTTDILGALICRGGQLTGVESDVKTNASTADTNWHEVTITFTPTQAGVVEIEAWAWWVASTADESVYVEDMTITQAD